MLTRPIWADIMYVYSFLAPFFLLALFSLLCLSQCIFTWRSLDWGVCCSPVPFPWFVRPDHSRRQTNMMGHKRREDSVIRLRSHMFTHHPVCDVHVRWLCHHERDINIAWYSNIVYPCARLGCKCYPACCLMLTELPHGLGIPQLINVIQFLSFKKVNQEIKE